MDDEDPGTKRSWYCQIGRLRWSISTSEKALGWADALAAAPPYLPYLRISKQSVIMYVY